MPNAHESNDDRLARRSARRWRRRARIFAPFLAVPGMLGVLMLSVNLIEHRPAPDRKRTPAIGRAPAPARPVERLSTTSALAAHAALPDGAAAPIVDGHALSPDAVIATAVAADMPLATGVETTGTAAELFDAPAPTAASDSADRAR